MRCLVSVLSRMVLALVLTGCATPAPRSGPVPAADPDPAAFWATFGADWRSNCLAWTHAPANPVLPPSGRTWQSRWTANPDVLTFRGRTILYYRGRGRT